MFVKQGIEYDSLWVNFKRDTHIFTFCTRTGITVFWEGYARESKLIVTLSGEKKRWEKLFSFYSLPRLLNFLIISQWLSKCWNLGSFLNFHLYVCPP